MPYGVYERKVQIKECSVCANSYETRCNKSHMCPNCTSSRDKESEKLWKERNRDRYLAIKRKHSKEYGQRPEVKAAKAARQKKREMLKRKAIPLWADEKEINYVYALAQERGLEVDHIVPINSELVCGLHTEDNLRCIPKELNIIKGNRCWPDMGGAL